MVTTAVKGRGRPSSREAMLDAAEAVVFKRGVAKLTLDAVADESGTSKGGVMYNFPSKDALVTALIDRLVAGSEKGVAKIAAKLPERPDRELKAYVMNSVDDPVGDDRMSSALLAVVANDPELIARVREFFRARFERTSKGANFEMAALVHLATEGLWLLELLKVAPFTPRQRSRIAKRLVRMAEQSFEK